MNLSPVPVPALTQVCFGPKSRVDFRAQDLIGGRYGMSTCDIEKLNKVYKCDGYKYNKRCSNTETLLKAGKQMTNSIPRLYHTAGWQAQTHCSEHTEHTYYNIAYFGRRRKRLAMAEN